MNKQGQSVQKLPFPVLVHIAALNTTILTDSKYQGSERDEQEMQSNCYEISPVFLGKLCWTLAQTIMRHVSCNREEDEEEASNISLSWMSR